jgi:hypothetical protein
LSFRKGVKSATPLIKDKQLCIAEPRPCKRQPLPFTDAEFLARLEVWAELSSQPSLEHVEKFVPPFD